MTVIDIANIAYFYVIYGLSIINLLKIGYMFLINCFEWDIYDKSVSIIWQSFFKSCL